MADKKSKMNPVLLLIFQKGNPEFLTVSLVLQNIHSGLGFVALQIERGNENDCVASMDSFPGGFPQPRVTCNQDRSLYT